MAHKHLCTQTHDPLRTHQWHTSQQEHRFPGFFCCFFWSCVWTQRCLRKWELLTLVSRLFPHVSISLRSLFLFSFPFQCSLHWYRYRHPKPTAFKFVKPPFVDLHPYPYTHNTWHNPTTGKALSQNRQENSGKPGYNLALMEPKRFPPGRWAPSYWEKPKDRQRKLHPGKCLCSTLGSLAFCPANEWLFIYS